MPDAPNPAVYPLSWPEGMERASIAIPSQFKTTLNGAMNNVRDSLRRFGADTKLSINANTVVISSNVSLGEQSPKDPGVAVWFQWDGAWRCIAVDRYKTVADNLQAIHHVIEAERTKMRHGGLHIVRATFRSYMALPGTGKRDCWAVLGIRRGATREEIRTAYREKSRTAHPDSGGTEEAMKELNQARHEALQQSGAGA